MIVELDWRERRVRAEVGYQQPEPSCGYPGGWYLEEVLTIGDTRVAHRVSARLNAESYSELEDKIVDAAPRQWREWCAP